MRILMEALLDLSELRQQERLCGRVWSAGSFGSQGGEII